MTTKRPRRTKGEIAFQEPDSRPSEELEKQVAALASKSVAIRYSLQETRVQEQVVNDLMQQGYSARECWRAMQADARRPEIRKATFKRVSTLYTRIHERWIDEGLETMKTAKQAARFRLRQVRAWALGERDPVSGKWITKPDHAAVYRYEKLLMQIEGTAAPIAVSVDQTYTQAMLQVTANLTGEQAGELLEEAREQARLAGMARELLPALVVEGQEAKP